MVLTNYSKYHWPSQRAIIAVLTIAVAIVGMHGQYEMGGLDGTQVIMSLGVIIGGSWLLVDAIFHMIELASENGYRLHRACVRADSVRPIFLTFVAACNLFFAADLVFSKGSVLTGIVFLHVVHSVIFIYVLMVDWYIDNSKKLEKARYKRRG